MNETLSPHITDDDLVLHYYGEHRNSALVDLHLGECRTCAATFEDIVSTLAAVDDSGMPARDEHYGLEVWQRIRPVLPERRSRFDWLWRPIPAFGLGAAAAALTFAIFTAGRYWPAVPVPQVALEQPNATPSASALELANERALAAAVADHLERSERVLVDLANDARPADLDVQQAAARDLIDVNRLYREAANEAGDSTVAGVLDDLERTLLDIVHAPTTLTPGELAVVRARLDAAALLFKIRILSNELRDREAPPVAPRKTT